MSFLRFYFLILLKKNNFISIKCEGFMINMDSSTLTKWRRNFKMSKVLTEHGFVDVDDNYLMHYGVMGMKWGVRRYQKYGEGGYLPKAKRAAEKTYSKSLKKLNKLDKKASKYKLKAAKNEQIGAGRRYKGELLELRARNKRQLNKAQNIKLQGGKYLARAARYENTSLKNTVKAEKWANKMDKNLKNVPVENLTDDQKKLLKKYGVEHLAAVKDMPAEYVSVAKSREASKNTANTVIKGGSEKDIKKSTSSSAVDQAQKHINAVKANGYTMNADLGNDFFSKKKNGVQINVEDDIADTTLKNAKTIESNLSNIKTEFSNQLKKEGFTNYDSKSMHITVFDKMAEIGVESDDGHVLSMYVDPKTGKLEKVGGVMMNG